MLTLLHLAVARSSLHQPSLRCHMSQLLRSIVGDDAVARILNALETDAADAIALRRTTASGRWINLHTDTAARTLHVSA